jgi:hypothetical protein
MAISSSEMLTRAELHLTQLTYERAELYQNRKALAEGIEAIDQKLQGLELGLIAAKAIASTLRVLHDLQPVEGALPNDLF